MKRLGKVITFFFTVLSMSILACAASFAAERTEVTEKLVIVTKDGYEITIEEVQEPESRVNPDRTATKSYDSTFRDRNGVLLGVYRATFTGMYSTVDNVSEMADVKVAKRSGSYDYVSWEKRTEGQDGFVTYYVLGEYAITVSAHISPNGTITIASGQ